MTAVCAKPTAGVDVNRSLPIEECMSQSRGKRPYRSRVGTGVCAKTAIRLRARNSLHRPFATSPTARSHIFPAEQSANSLPTARRGPLPSRFHSAEAKVRRDLADLAARFEEVNAETIVEIRALQGRDPAHAYD